MKVSTQLRFSFEKTLVNLRHNSQSLCSACSNIYRNAACYIIVGNGLRKGLWAYDYQPNEQRRVLCQQTKIRIKKTNRVARAVSKAANRAVKADSRAANKAVRVVKADSRAASKAARAVSRVAAK